MSSHSPATASICDWARSDELNRVYHDEEWGVPVFEENRLFEMLTLEGAQAGLSWLTILKKRNGYRETFSEFDPQRVAGYDQSRIDKLVLNPAIVRHRGKIEATVNNARRILALWETGHSLAETVWDIVDGSPQQNKWHTMQQVPSHTPASRALSKKLKKLGFRFVGETTSYAFMQAAGLVNDHLVSCFRHAHCHNLAESSARKPGETRG